MAAYQGSPVDDMKYHIEGRTIKGVTEFRKSTRILGLPNKIELDLRA